MEKGTGNYFSRAKNWGPSKTLVTALELLNEDKRVPTPGFAIDLGCGEGRDTRYLLDQGWRVLATDRLLYAVGLLLDSVKPAQKERLEYQICNFAQTNWRPATLINASLCLPYCPRQDFPFVWSQIIASIVPDGLFVGDFFAPVVESDPSVCCYSGDQVRAFLSPFTIESFQTWEGAFAIGGGRQIIQPAFSVIARRK